MEGHGSSERRSEEVKEGAGRGPLAVGGPAHGCEESDMSRTHTVVIGGLMLATFVAVFVAMQRTPIKTYEAIALQRIGG